MKSILLLLLLATAGFADQPNLIQNGDFSHQTEGWSVGSGQKVAVDGGALRVDLERDGGSSYGEVSQNLKAKPRTLYRLEGRIRSTKAGFAFLSLKLRQDRRELKRIGLAKSQTEWTNVTHEFSTEAADEIQVLCRWERNAERGWLGQSGWFDDLRLVEVGAAPPPPLWIEAITLAAAIKPVAAPPLPLKPTDTDIFVTPTGAGNRDGSSWDNALPGNAPGVLQAAWDALAPGRVCRVGSGVYANVSLAITTGGTGPDKMKRLVGEGQAWFVGNWNPEKVEGGSTFLSLRNEVDYCAFENLQLARYHFGIHTSKGKHVGLRVRNCGMYEFRYGIYLNGHAYADQPDAASHDIEITDCKFTHFTKNAVRLQAGNYDVRLINVVADAGGRDWMKEAFQICYQISGDHARRQSNKDPKQWAADHDLIFINCVARNCIWAKSRYWQGDGFCAENDVRNLAFINCMSHDNADGGWDVKARNVVYVNCIGLRNKMNFRVWQHGFFYNCLSAFSFKRGGSWTTAGMWAIGDARADHCTFYNNDTQQILADKKGDAEAKITLHNCIVTGEHLYNGETRITATNVSTNSQEIATAPNKEWTGEPPGAFDSPQGYQSSVAAKWCSQSADELVHIARALLKHTGWEDFTNQVTLLLR